MTAIREIEAAFVTALAPLATLAPIYSTANRLKVVGYSGTGLNGSTAGDRVVVAYQRSTWGPPLTEPFGPTLQDRTFQFQVGYLMTDAKLPRTREEVPRDIQDILDDATDLLVGFRPELREAGNHSLLQSVYALSDGFVTLANGVWLFASLFAVPTRYYGASR